MYRDVPLIELAGFRSAVLALRILLGGARKPQPRCHELSGVLLPEANGAAGRHPEREC